MRKVFAVLAVLFTVTFTSRAQAACVAGDISAPSRIIDLKSLSISDTGLIISLTAPADASTLAAYDIRWRTDAPLNGFNWTTAMQMSSEPAPSTPGTLEATNINGLTPDTTYYIGIKAQDACGKWSTLSNVIQVTTLATPPPPPKILATFKWIYTPEEEAMIDGFYIYYGETSRIQHPELFTQFPNPTTGYPAKTEVLKSVRTVSLVLEQGKTYYFSLTAYRGDLESPYSENEVVIP